jgi:hypothetical protein
MRPRRTGFFSILGNQHTVKQTARRFDYHCRRTHQLPRAKSRIHLNMQKPSTDQPCDSLRHTLRASAASYWAVALAIFVGIFASWIAIHYAGQPLLESYGFRQTQTALTSFWMIKEGWQLAYQTPVAGYPWAIPFEFPFFQSLVALISWWSSYPLDPTGRLLSFSFLIACAWPAFTIMRRLALPPKTAWIFCALLWSSPLYLFWGRTFMIETAALFFTLMAIPYAIDLNVSRPAWRSASLFAFWGTMGMLQKATTTGPAIVAVALILLTLHINTTGLRLPSARQLICVGVAISLPIIAAAWWTHYTDLVKEQNVLGSALTSKALTQWNFGTIDQRLDARGLKIIFWNRVIAGNAAGLFGIYLVGSALFSGDRRARNIVLAGIILFALPILIFTNLHRIHSYYQVSAAVFLISAVAIALTLWSPRLAEQSSMAPAILALLALCNLLDLETSRVLFFDPAIDILKNNEPGAWGIFLLLGGSVIFGGHRVRKIILVGSISLVFLILVVTNIFHAYISYPAFSVVFLICALAAATMLCLPARILRPSIVPIVTLLLVFANLYHFSTNYADKLWTTESTLQQPILNLGKTVRENTPEDSGIVIFGADWSSEIAYYAQRKSFTVPNWFKQYGEAWNVPASFLGEKKLGAIVFCMDNQISLEKIMEQPDVKRQPQLLQVGKCYLWLPRSEPMKTGHSGI